MQVEPSAILTGRLARLASRAIAGFAVACIALATAMPASAATLERIRQTGHIKLGYVVDARPFSYRNEAGTADGYSVALCQRIAEQVRTQLALPQLAVDWVPVTIDSRLREVQQGNVDLLCTLLTVTQARRQEVAFSIPIFGGGNRAVLRADAPSVLREVLAEASAARPVWRGAPAAKVLQGTSFAVVSGTTTQSWLESRRTRFQIDARIIPVPDYQTGLRQLLDRKVDVFFGDRAIVLGAMDGVARQKLMILDRLFTQELAALALARNDDDFRLLVDSTLSRIYVSNELADLYTKWFGPFSDNARTFFLWNTLPQ